MGIFPAGGSTPKAAYHLSYSCAPRIRSSGDGVASAASAVPTTSKVITPIIIIKIILRGFFISMPLSLSSGWLVEIYPLWKLYIIENNK
jgi:hypothetical protein